MVKKLIQPWGAACLVENLEIEPWTEGSKKPGGAKDPKRAREILNVVARGDNTFEEIGARFNCSRQRINQIWNKWMGEYKKPQTRDLKNRMGPRHKPKGEVSYCQRAACGRPIEKREFFAWGFRFCSTVCLEKMSEVIK